MAEVRDGTNVRTVDVDASIVSAWKSLNGVGGIPGPAPAHPGFPDMTALWSDANVTLVRSFDWVSRLDTVDNPDSLFPDWTADPSDPASYNFTATDHWVEAVQAIGADVLFTFASSIPSNKVPASDLQKYGQVVEQIVRHYSSGWADGPAKPIRMYEFGDQPDLGPLHFVGHALDFFRMYEEFATAVKRVDPGLVAGGPSLAFPLNVGADYREGFLTFVRERELPLDFFSFLWFTDASRDPRDYAFVTREMRTLLDSLGFTETKLLMSYWNYLAIPSSTAPAAEKAAFQVATAIQLQDTPLDYALFFRADSGKDPHYGFVDPAGVTAEDGTRDERGRALALIGQTMSGERLAASGSDESGFSVAAGRDGESVRILLTNFVAPESALVKRDADEFRFRIPIGPSRIEIGYRLPPQLDGLASANVRSARIVVRNLPWPGRTVIVERRSLHGDSPAGTLHTVSDAGTLELEVGVDEQSVTLVTVTPQAG